MLDTLKSKSVIIPFIICILIVVVWTLRYPINEALACSRERAVVHPRIKDDRRKLFRYCYFVNAQGGVGDDSPIKGKLLADLYTTREDLAPNETILYQGQGLSIEIPYNLAWGTNGFKINPFELRSHPYWLGPLGESSQYIEFGPLERGGDSLSRYDEIQIFPARSLVEVRDYFYPNSDVVVNPSSAISRPIQMDVDTVQAFYFEEDRGCTGLTNNAYVVGKTHNYIIRLPCGDPEQNKQIIEAMVRSIKLIDN